MIGSEYILAVKKYRYTYANGCIELFEDNDLFPVDGPVSEIIKRADSIPANEMGIYQMSNGTYLAKYYCHNHEWFEVPPDLMCELLAQKK